MLNKFKNLIYIFFLITPLFGHAPWGQHQVYRQMHMLIMCSKKDVGAYSFTKKLINTFDVYLPKAKARVARAPHEERIIDMLKTNQIPLALLSYDLVQELTKKDSEYSEFFKNNIKIIYSFSDMLLVSNNEFNENKSLKIYHALNKASDDNFDSNLEFIPKNNVKIIFDKKVKEELAY